MNNTKQNQTFLQIQPKKGNRRDVIYVYTIVVSILQGQWSAFAFRIHLSDIRA